jgi:flagellar biogenesis protein FliO
MALATACAVFPFGTTGKTLKIFVHSRRWFHCYTKDRTNSACGDLYIGGRQILFPNATRQAGPGSAAKTWVLPTVIGVVAILCGISLPRAMPRDIPLVADKSHAEPTERGKLDYVPPAWPEAPDSKSMLLRLGLGTVIVLALCVGTLWVGKRWLGVATGATDATGQLRVVETLALTNRCSLLLVNAANCQVLVGIDQSGLKSLVTLPERFESSLHELQTPSPVSARDGSEQ